MNQVLLLEQKIINKKRKGIHFCGVYILMYASREHSGIPMDKYNNFYLIAVVT